MEKTAQFQSFEDKSERDKGPERLASLRAAMKELKLDAYLVPRSDQFRGEYVTERDERLAWLTGFTGSAGFCAALLERAAVFVDGRYTVQVKQQTADVFHAVDWPDTSLETWLVAQLAAGALVGLDPWVYSLSEVLRLQDALSKHNIELSFVENIVDRLWENRPSAHCEPATIYPLQYAGQSALEKIGALAKELRERGDAATIITLPENVSWLLNIRGNDITHVPSVQSYAIVHAAGQVDLFIDPQKSKGIASELPETVSCHPFSDFKPQLTALKGPVAIDPMTLPYAVIQALDAAQVSYRETNDPIALPKACKNTTEQEQARQAHQRDALAMCHFLAWLDAQEPAQFTEIDVAIALEGFRSANNVLRDISFDTISASGPNAALPHYRVSRNSNRTVNEGEIFLVDSGGQYLDGTTDITRTVAIGTPSDEVCDAFTRVLKGMIAISRLSFPKGIGGHDIDAFARASLWSAGLDYAHGTGHGVGHYLSVHEGPQRISRLPTGPLLAGMMVSNEPGYYKEGHYGIRIENILLVREGLENGQVPKDGFLSFETLNYVPIDLRLVNIDLLNDEEKNWLNAYHKQCRERLSEHLSQDALTWLNTAARDI